MKVKKYGSIYIGTYEVSLRIYEVRSKDSGLKELDEMRLPVQISHDIYKYGMITQETSDTVIRALQDMKQSLDEYRVDFYQAFGVYSLTQASNYLIFFDRIRIRCGLFIKLLTNSQQRFYSFEALTAQPGFSKMTEKSALLADIGGSSIQLTLFEDGKLLTTQHILFGAGAVRENLFSLSEKSDARQQVLEMIFKETDNFFHMYLPDRNPEYLILMNENFSNLLRTFDVREVLEKPVSREKAIHFLSEIGDKDYFRNTFEKYHINDPDEMLLPFLLLYDAMILQTECQMITAPGISVHEGITLDSLYRTGSIKPVHDFDADVISAAYFIAERCGSYKPHIKMMDRITSALFDAIYKKSGMTPRQRLLIRVIAILHDCGKYLSLSFAAQSSYTIIMSSEILGITHDERKLIALVARYHHEKDVSFARLANDLSEEEYMIFLKLLALLRICNALDSSHRQKFKDLSIRMRGERLLITVASKMPLNLEKSYFRDKAAFFTEVFGIIPEIRDRKEI